LTINTGGRRHRNRRAAGDITCGGMQLVTAAGEGAVAALQVRIYLRKKA